MATSLSQKLTMLNIVLTVSPVYTGKDVSGEEEISVTNKSKEHKSRSGVGKPAAPTEEYQAVQPEHLTRQQH